MTMELMMTVFIAIGMILVLLVYPIFFDDNGIDNGIDDDDSRWSTGDENDPLVNIQKAIENDHR